MALTHRLQLLLEEEQFARLTDQAERQGRSVGSMIREAIDTVWLVDREDRQRAADVILAAPAMPVVDPDDFVNELDHLRAGRFQ